MSKLFFGRLALSNLKRNRRFYYPYVLACAVTIAMFYIIMALNAGHTLDSFKGEMILRSYMAMGAIVIAIFAIIFLFYTSSFLSRRRKREFGLYSILGMEKRHIARAMLVETLIIAVVSLAGGLALGVMLAKLVGLGTAKLVRMDAAYGFEFEGKSALITLIVFAGIFAISYLFEALRIWRVSAIELFKDADKGEREPKTKWLLTLVGAATMGGGYYIAIATVNPVKAMALFLVAVVLVIIGTYLLFTTGSIAVLKSLRANKAYYYKPNHFISVSGMIYRMKQNAAGLATICILSTMVLVMVSATVSLAIGNEDVVRRLYSHEFMIAPHEPSADVWQNVDDALALSGAEKTSASDFYRLEFAAAVRDEALDMNWRGSDVDDAARITFILYDDYLKLGDEEKLPMPGEGDVLAVRGGYEGGFLTVGDLTLRVSGRDTHFMELGQVYLYTSTEEYTFVVRDMQTLERIEAKQREAYGANASQTIHWYAFDIPLEGDALKAACSDVQDALDSIGGYTCVGPRSQGREEQYAIGGGLMFLGIFLGVLFMMAMVLMMYYKQISEGYDDRLRFEIMRKVGLDDREIRRSIRSQVLTVFFLPLIVACMHTCGAFFIVRRVMLVFGLNNQRLMLMCTAGSMLLFAAFYVATYLVTASVYYRIVAVQPRDALNA